jgi:Neuraminidase (sialidase)
MFVYSDDNGRSWHDYQAHNPMPDAPSFNLTRLADGSLFAINYHGYVAPLPNQSVIETAVSKDNGATWTMRDGLMTGPQNFAPYACERPTGCTAFVQVHNLIQDRDGTMYQSAYGRYDGDAKLRQVLLVSDDGGVNWTVRSTVAYSDTLYPPGTSYDGYCEGVLTRTRDGGLLIVMRTGSYLPMYVSYSGDNGRTWAAPQQIRTPSGRTVSSVYPALNRLADGSLLLMVGRPGYSFLRSTDDGRTWSEPTWADYQDSANGYVLPLDGNTVMLFGDRGANWQSPLQYAVWSRTVTVH